MLAVAFVLGSLGMLFGIGGRKGTPEEFASALEKHLLRQEPDPGWDDPMDVVLADPRLEQVRRRLGPNLDSLAQEGDKDELRAVIAALRRGDLPCVSRSAGARAARNLGYVWVLCLLVFLLSGGTKTEPLWVTILGLLLSGFLIWITFRGAKKMEAKARHDVEPGNS
jgi:hypothetical protein